MKKLILILLSPILGYSQQSIQHYFVSSQNLAGAEMIVNTGNDTFIGGGFSGTLKNSLTNGEWRGRTICKEEMKYTTGVAKEEWCSLYGVASFGYLEAVRISFTGGAGLYGQMRNFEENGIAYHKNDKLIFVPLAGFNAQYSISDDIGAFAGVDTFNGFKIGLSIHL
jgi:hypothetical protein